MKQNEANRNTI